MRALTLVVVLASLPAAARTAQAPVPDDSPITRGRVAFTLADREIIPESLAYDPAARSFYVGSLYKRKISRIVDDGRVTDFVPQARDGIWGVLGIKIDPVRRELWATRAISRIATRQ